MRTIGILSSRPEIRKIRYRFTGITSNFIIGRRVYGEKLRGCYVFSPEWLGDIGFGLYAGVGFSSGPPGILLLYAKRGMDCSLHSSGSTENKEGR